MITLNNRDKINKSKIRVGRGIGSGKGKTSGRGVKGQKSRSGVAIKSFEGGQMPLYRRLPKRGFNRHSSIKLVEINLSNIETLIKKKKIKSEQEISLDFLKKTKLVNKSSNKLKILGTGDLSQKMTFKVNSISKSAKEKIEKVGGSVQLVK